MANQRDKQQQQGNRGKGAARPDQQDKGQRKPTGQPQQREQMQREGNQPNRDQAREQQDRGQQMPRDRER